MQLRICLGIEFIRQVPQEAKPCQQGSCSTLNLGLSHLAAMPAPVRPAPTHGRIP